MQLGFSLVSILSSVILQGTCSSFFHVKSKNKKLQSHLLASRYHMVLNGKSLTSHSMCTTLYGVKCESKIAAKVIWNMPYSIIFLHHYTPMTKKIG